MTNFLSLATGVLSIFAVSFGPFALMGQIPQVLSRLFPFTRGLNHAYWAPNAWALVTVMDRALLKGKYIQSTASRVYIGLNFFSYQVAGNRGQFERHRHYLHLQRSGWRHCFCCLTCSQANTHIRHHHCIPSCKLLIQLERVSCSFVTDFLKQTLEKSDI